MPGVRRLRSAARPWPRIAAALTLVAVSLAATVLAPAGPADAAVARPFTKVFSRQANGAIQITGNTLMTCGTSTSCLQAQDGSVAASNNNFTMGFLDVDTDPSTTRSSSANLTIPTGARVLYAGLFWGAATTAGTDGVAASGSLDRIRFRTPGASGYTTLTADRVDLQSSATDDYSAYRNVTALVQGAGAGRYWGADVPAATGVDRYAGWSLVVALEDPAAPLRDLTVFNGYATVIKNEIVDTTISGFLTPLSGAVDAKFGMVTYEGDNSLTGDYFQVGTTRLADALSPSANFFTSRVSSGGSNATNRTPNAVNTLGLDAKVVDAPGVVRNGATSTNVRFATNGDFYYPAALTTQIDLYAPTIQGSKTVTNLSGSSPARVGDVLEYSLTFSNTGEDAAVRSVVADALPPGTTFVPGSLRYTAGAAPGPKTDGAGDDQAEYDAATRTVRARIGRDATATTGGALVSSNTATVVFRVRVDPAAAGTTLRNTATLDYRAQTIGRDYTYQTAEVATPVAEEADVSVTKTASADPVTAGSQITYTLTARNAGPSTAAGVQVVDTLPSGVTYVSSSPSSGSCSASSGTLTCDVGNLPSGNAATVTVVVRVPADSDATSVTNVARVTSTTSDPDPSNNNASVSTGVVRQADLALTASASPTSPVPGTDVTYTLVATNDGTSRAGAVRISDTLPSALVVTSATTDQGSCAVTGSQVVCSAGAVDPGQSVRVTVVARVPSGAGSASLVNTATVTSSTSDPAPGNNTASSTVTPAAPSADLTVTKRTTTSPVVAGRPVQYVVTVGNDGPSDAAGVTLDDQLPAGITGAAASTTAGSCTVVTGTVSCALGTVPAGRSVQVTIDGQLAASATGTLVNSATAATTTADPVPGNDTGTSSVAIDARADLAVTKSAGTVTDGNVATYTIVVTNHGPSTARSVEVTDPVPAPLAYVGSASDRGTCVATGAPATVSCDVGDLAVGESATVTVEAQTPADGGARGTSNTATATSPTTDPTSGNNSATYVLPTASQADLSLTKTATPNPVVAGGTVTWRLTAHNNGPSLASAVTIEDAVPARVTDVTATTTTPGADCAPVTGNDVTCTVGSLPPGDDLVVEVTGTVLASARGALANDATVEAATPVDPSTGNNTASASTEVVARADLVVTRTGPTTATAGTTATWDVTVRNDGPSTATDVRLVDSVPSGVTVVGATALPAGVSCSVVDGALTCPVGDLAPGEELTVSVDGRISSALADGTALVGNAAASSGTPDPSSGNNADDHTTTVVERSHLHLAKASDPATLVPGAESSYLLTITNGGPSDARSVVVTDDLDPDLTVIDAGLPGGTCDVVGQLVTCRLAVLPADASTVVRIRVLVAPERRTPLANTASVAAPSDDTPANDTASVTSTVEPNADLQVVTTASKGHVAAGEGLTYTLTVVNNGPSAADAATVEDTFPAGIVPTAVSTTAGTCTASGQLVQCALGQVLPGTPVVVTVDASTPPDATAGTRTSTATVAASTADAANGNNTAEVAVDVVNRADVQVTTTADSSSFVPGRTVSWTILFTNAGPSTARGVVVTDTVPDAVTITSAVHGTASPCTVTGQQVACDLGDRAPGQRVIKVVGTLASAYTGSTLVNTGRTTTTTTDPTPANDSSTSTTPISRLTDLEVVGTVSPADPVAGQRVTYTMSVYNNGPSDALNPQLIDQLPSGLTDVVIRRPTLLGTPATAECELRAPTDPGTADNPTAPTVFCNGPVFRAGLPARVIGSVEATIAPGFTGSLVNTGRVSSDTIDVVASNNESSVTSEVGAAADVSITKTLTPASPVPGGTAVWTLTVRNDGPSVARDVVVRDDVPDAISDLAATTDAGSCTVAAGNDVTCSLGDLAPGATAVVTLAGGVPAGFTGDLDNTATVASPTDTTPGNNTATASSTTTPEAHVSITKALTPAAPVPGRDVTWTVTVSNAGPSVAHDVVVHDDVPDAIGRLTATTDAGSCSVADGNDVTCHAGDLAPGTSTTVTLTGGLPAGFTGSLDNTATVTSPDDSTPADNVATAHGTAAPDGAVAITKTVQPTTPVPGRPVTWTLVVTGTGPSTARDVVVRDDVLDAVTGLTATTDTGSCTVLAGNDVACPIGDLAPGDRAVLTLTGDVPASWRGPLSNTATVASPTDSSPADNTATAAPATAPGADLSIVKTATPEVLVPGQDVTWTLTVTNAGPSVARDVVVADDVVDELGDVTASAPCTVAAGNEVTCALGDVAAAGAGASRTITITGRVPPGFTGHLANTATVSSDTDDADPSDNSSTTTRTAQPTAGVSITKTASPVHPVPGRTASWTLRVTNAGPSVARDVQVVDDVVDALTGVTATTGRTPEPCTVAAGNEVGCDLGDLAAGETVTITVAGGVPASYTGTTDNTATVTSPTDTTPGDNTDSTSGTAQPRADLTVSKSLTPARPVPGETATWTVTVVNVGPSTARRVTVADDVPAAITDLAVEATGGPCTVAAGSRVSCDLGDLDAGASRVVTLRGTLAPDFVGTLSNTATVTSPTDATPDDNSATVTGEAAPRADLAITKAMSPAAPVAGAAIDFTMVVTNDGPSTARQVEVVDQLVPVLGHATASVTGGGTCRVEGQRVTCAVPALASGSSVTVSLRAVVDPAWTGEVTNVATVDAATPDPDPSDNTARVSQSGSGSCTPVPGNGRVVTCTDLDLDKTVAPQSAGPGDEVTYTLTVTNAGPSTATDVAVVDELDDDLALVSAEVASGQARVTTDDRTVTAVFGSVRPGTEGVVRIVTRVADDATGAVANTASAVTGDDGTGAAVQDTADVEVLGVEATSHVSGDPGDRDDHPDGVLPDTGLAGPVAPLAGLSALLVVVGAWLVRRSRVSGGRHRGRHV